MQEQQDQKTPQEKNEQAQHENKDKDTKLDNQEPQSDIKEHADKPKKNRQSGNKQKSNNNNQIEYQLKGTHDEETKTNNIQTKEDKPKQKRVRKEKNQEENKGTETNETQEKDQEKKLPNKRNRNKKEEQNQEENATGEKPKRNHQKVERDFSWKEELKTTMTVDTKIPAYPTKEELLTLPQKEKLYKKYDELDDKIEELFRRVDDLHLERKAIKKTILGQNKGAREELSVLIKEAKELNAKIDAEYDKIKDTKQERMSLEDRLLKLEKRAYQGKILSEETLKKIIREKEDEFKNSRHTATEEKKYLDSVEALKAAMPLSSEAEKIRKQLTLLKTKTKEPSDALKLLQPLRIELNGKIKKISDKLNHQKEDDKKKTDEQKQLEKESKKNEYIESAEEKKIRSEIDGLMAKIKELKAEKISASKKFESERDAYFAQKLEMDKLEYMWDIMDVLKAEDRKKKAAEEGLKRREEELSAKRELIATKFEKEVQICDYLLSHIEQVRIINKMKNAPVGKQEVFEHKVDENALKKQNLVVMKTKKDNEEVVPVKKIPTGKKSKKNESKIDSKTTENDEFSVDLHTLEHFGLVKVAVPKSLDELDTTIQLVTDKKNEFLKARDDEVAKFNANPPEVNVNEERRAYDGDRKRAPRDNRDNRENRGNFRRSDNRKEEEVKAKEEPEEEKPKPKKQKKVDYNDELFPTLH